jgi:hypothetical protein
VCGHGAQRRSWRRRGVFVEQIALFVPKSSGTLSTEYVIVGRKIFAFVRAHWGRERGAARRARHSSTLEATRAPGSDHRAGVTTPFATAVRRAAPPSWGVGVRPSVLALRAPGGRVPQARARPAVATSDNTTGRAARGRGSRRGRSVADRGDLQRTPARARARAATSLKPLSACAHNPNTVRLFKAILPREVQTLFRPRR